MDYQVDQYEIRSYHVDTKRLANPAVLFQFMQDSAWRHAEKIGVGYEAMYKKGYIWVLTKQWVHFYRLPKWGEKIWVYTWPTLCEHVFCYRDFRLVDESQNVIGIATSSWCAIDIRKHLPVPTKNYWTMQMEKDIDHIDIGKLEKIGVLHSQQHDLRILIGYKDLDVNGHVSNTRYFQWILDTYPREFHERCYVQEVLINFLKEAFYNEQLLIYTQRISKFSNFHNLRKYADKKEIYRCRLDWKELD